MVRLTKETIEVFEKALQKEEKSVQTIQKYQRDLSKLAEFLDGKELTQKRLEDYKRWLIEEKNYKVRSANSYLSCANHFCKIMEQSFFVSAYKLDRAEKKKEVPLLSMEEYERLAKTAIKKSDSVMALVIQILSTTDLRVTELYWITVESLQTGKVEIVRGGERITMELPDGILADLKQYAKKKGYQSGIVFRTSHGNPVDRFQLWKRLKRLCSDAGVERNKVSFQNLKRPLERNYYPLKLEENVQ